jgi:transposase
MSGKSKSEKIVRDIKRHTRRKYSSEEKIRIVLEGLRGETSIAELCRREGLNPNVYYRWSKDFLEAGKRRLEGDTLREANTDQVKALREENSQLKQGIADLFLHNRVLKKNQIDSEGHTEDI